jgi:hypothetical protein
MEPWKMSRLGFYVQSYVFSNSLNIAVLGPEEIAREAQTRKTTKYTNLQHLYQRTYYETGYNDGKATNGVATQK